MTDADEEIILPPSVDPLTKKIGIRHVTGHLTGPSRISDRLQAALGGNGFAVVALNINREGKRKAKRMMRRLKLKDLSLNLDRAVKVAKTLGVINMPTTFLFDRQGREIGKLEGGAEWDEKESIRLMKYFIDNPGYADTLPAFKKKKN